MRSDDIFGRMHIVEQWNPSVRLRNVERDGKLVLQQFWTSNLGEREWRDVPTELEDK